MRKTLHGTFLNIDEFIEKCYTNNKKIRRTRIVTEEGDT